MPTQATYQLNIEIQYTDLRVGNISQYEGDYLILTTFSTRDSLCELQMFHLIDVQEVVKGEAVSLLSVSIDYNDTITDISSFKQRIEATWDFGHDFNQEITVGFGIQVLPTTFLFDPFGKLLKVWVGVTEANEILTELDNYISIPGRLKRQFIRLLANPIFSGFLGISTVILLYSVYKLYITRKNLSKNT
ncbi:MAG: redoxin domain-containing protein [Candidatus Heimdallarchaeota archaeon]|nr:redoxin domain-containing protein [Candidatus Heimdallarchaeota archaeon]